MSIDLKLAFLSLNILLFLISLFLGGTFSLNQDKEWTKYTYNKHYSTTNTFLLDQILRISTGIFGLQLGPLIAAFANISVPSDLDNGRGLASFDVNFIAGKGQTLSNNFLNFTDAVYKRKFGRDKKLKESLNRDLYTAYYNLTMQGKSKEDINTAIDNAMHSLPYSLPFFLKTLVDPTDIKRITSNITEAGKDLIQRERITSPLSDTSLLKALALRSSMLNMVLDANLRSLGETKKIDPITNKELQIASYSGFTGKAVSLLAKVLALSTNVLQGDLNPDQIKRSIEDFQKTVQNTTKALMPLRDIFGQDIKAMVTTLLAITSQPIARISPLRIQTLSRDIVSAMRSNPLLTAGDIVRSGKALLMLGMQAQLNQVGMLSVRQAGIRFAHFMSDNNITPWGMTTDYFRGQVGKNIIDALKSLDKLLVSQAFAIWKEGLTKDNPRTLLQFKSLLRASINRGLSTDDFIFGKVLNLGVKNRVDLYERAMSLGHYKTARQLDFSDIGAQAQLKEELQLQKKLVTSNKYLKGADFNLVLSLLLNGKTSVLNNIMKAESFEKLGEENKRIIGTEQNFRALQAMTQDNLKLRSLSIYAAKNRLIQDTNLEYNFISSILDIKNGGGSNAITDVYNLVTKNSSEDNTNKREQKISQRLKSKFDKILGLNAIATLLLLKTKSPQTSTMYLLMFRTGLQLGLLGDTKFQQKFKNALSKKQDFKADEDQKKLADALLLVYTMSRGNELSLKRVEGKWFTKDDKGNITGFTEQGKKNFLWFNEKIAQEKGNRTSISIKELANIGKQLSEREAAIDAADTWSKKQSEELQEKYNNATLLLKLIMFSTRSLIGKETTAKFLSNLIKQEKDLSNLDFSIRKQSLIDMGIAKLGNTNINDAALHRIKLVLGELTFNKVKSHLNFKNVNLSQEVLNLIPLNKRSKFNKLYKAYTERQDSDEQKGLIEISKYVHTAKSNVLYMSLLTRVLGQLSPLRVAGSASIKLGLQATLQSLNKVLQNLMGWLSSQKASGS